MPLTFGMNGDRGGGWFNFGGGPFGGGSSWWRPPGWFSGPLLAHPEFRARFLARLGEVCRTAFTPEKMEPFIRELEHRLEDEVQVQARLHRRDPDEALRLLRHHIQTLRNQVVHRREFILKQLAAKP
jgi:hypothetical protein